MTKPISLTRRQAIALGISAFAGVSTSSLLDRIDAIDQTQASSTTDRQEEFQVTDETPLKHRAIAKKLIYGGAASYTELTSDKKFANAVKQEYGILIAPEELMWAAVHPQRPQTFIFDRADWLANFASQHEMLFGANLVWHEYMPKWFEETVDKQNVEKILLGHIDKLTRHYAGKVDLWSVVNEAIRPEDGRSDGLRRTRWLETLGPEYIEISFRAAAAADPNALLYYNDNALEFDVPYQETRRTAVLKLLERLKSRGVPIHALGIQSHLGGPWSISKNLRAFIRNVADLDLKILISELDVGDRELPKDIESRDRTVARAYEDYLSEVLTEPAVIAVITWGLSDRYTWHSWYSPREDGAPARPLPLDANYNRKLAWNAIARAFDRAAIRETQPLKLQS